jgi:hypothetical protein
MAAYRVNLHKLRANQAQSTALKTRNHFTDQPALHTIGFYQYERSFHSSSSKNSFYSLTTKDTKGAKV